MIEIENGVFNRSQSSMDWEKWNILNKDMKSAIVGVSLVYYELD